MAWLLPSAAVLCLGRRVLGRTIGVSYCWAYIMRVIIRWAIVCMISVGIHGLGIMRNIICIIIVVGDIKRLRLAIILGWIM